MCKYCCLNSSSPESDHWLCLSLSDSLTHWLTHWLRLVNLSLITDWLNILPKWRLWRCTWDEPILSLYGKFFTWAISFKTETVWEVLYVNWFDVWLLKMPTQNLLRLLLLLMLMMSIVLATVCCRFLKSLFSILMVMFCRGWILVAILKLCLVEILNFKFIGDADVWLRGWCLVEIDLCLNLWYDLKKLLW